MYKNNIKSIAIGSFDGIHLGHKALIEQVEAVVIIERNGGYLTPGYKRSLYAKQFCFFYHFEYIRIFRAKEFVEMLKTDFPKLEKIVVGYDFGFGYKKEGNVQMLKELFDGKVQVVDEVKLQDISVHSRMIKTEIANGNMPLVEQLLNRPYRIDGQVVSGQGLGKKKLVATLNLNVYDYDLPKDGVYATRTKVADEWLKSVSFIGFRVTTDGSFAIETHVIDRDIGVLKGQVWVEFVAFIRENRKFDGLEALKTQINLDIIQAKSI
ncbi:MAG: Riboflavin kinase (EC / FMN adenylyltransferase (EC [uncultured Sulfurovum sp.]|uniref:Bifunctional riboflavin kinase/FMN adenylyltransferase n=1 Tax=uncultured Sulfurovum sp. TaxID=269237 RepID=A0A6S6S3K1_9BACT|nr:MAG: Riboflavin kinase (EC / FMN adenylyltransferase (EC [uncultured Sulfurovum sp.]